MLYIDGEHVDLSNQNKDYKFRKFVLDFIEKRDQWKSRFGNFVLIKSVYPPAVDSTGAIMGFKVMTVSNKANVHDPEVGTRKWVYSGEGATIKDGVAIPTEICKVIKFGEFTVDLETDSDYMYFLSHTNDFRRGRWYIYDEYKEEERVASERKDSSRLERAIYDDDSPLANPTTLKNVCARWGVNVTNKSFAAMQNALYSKIIELDEKKRKHVSDSGLNEFLNDIMDDKKVGIGADVQRAQDKGLLSYDKETNEWRLTVEKGQPKWAIYRVSDEDVPVARESLITHLNNNESDYNRLNLVLSGNAHIDKGQIVEGAPQDEHEEIMYLNASNVRGNNIVLLRKAMKHYALGSSFGMKKEEIEDVLVKFFEEQAEKVT